MAKIVRHRLARFALFITPALLGGGCDLRSKLWVEEMMHGIPGRALTVIDPWLDLVLAYNRGTAFSVVPDLGVVRLVMGLLALAIVLAFLIVVLKSSKITALEIFALGLVAGGAFGNGLDRLFHRAPGGGTGVVDFIRINYPWGGSWPAFNVADVLIAVGAALLLCGRFFKRSAAAPEAHASPRNPSPN
jgi:signal peptidase II